MRAEDVAAATWDAHAELSDEREWIRQKAEVVSQLVLVAARNPNIYGTLHMLEEVQQHVESALANAYGSARVVEYELEEER